MTQWVYGFGGGKADGKADMKNLLGGKGANLAEMSSIGLPVPPGFTITTEVCTHFYDNKQEYPKGLTDQVEKALHKIEKEVDCVFGDVKKTAAGIGALRRPRLHARHDGHGPEFGPER